jgi:hypothetical protein
MATTFHELFAFKLVDDIEFRNTHLQLDYGSKVPEWKVDKIDIPNCSNSDQRHRLLIRGSLDSSRTASDKKNLLIQTAIYRDEDLGEVAQTMDKSEIVFKLDEFKELKPLAIRVSHVNYFLSNNLKFNGRKYLEKEAILRESLADDVIDYLKFRDAVKKRYPFTYQEKLAIQLADLIQVSILIDPAKFLGIFLGSEYNRIPLTDENGQTVIDEHGQVINVLFACLRSQNILDVKIPLNDNNKENILYLKVILKMDEKEHCNTGGGLSIEVYQHSNGDDIPVGESRNIEIDNVIYNANNIIQASASCEDTTRIGNNYYFQYQPFTKENMLQMDSVLRPLSQIDEATKTGFVRKLYEFVISLVK